ncbi:MAG: hypothetical protein WC656_10690 [Sulfurimonas sp.]|jgi:hypothetical protein
MKNIIVANTFTPIYDEIEDRLRVVINYQDINNRVDFMITRNFILNLVPSVDEFIFNYYSYNSRVKESFNINSNKKNDDNTSQTDRANLEFLRTNEELLVEVNLTYEPNTKKTLITFSSKNITTEALLDGLLLKQIFNLIKSAIPHFKWGIAYNF